MDTPIQKLINKLTQDANFFDGENDSREDKIVGQYIKNVIVSDLIENYLELERKVIIDFHVECVRAGTERENETYFSKEDEVQVRQDAENFYNNTFTNQS